MTSIMPYQYSQAPRDSPEAVLHAGLMSSYHQPTTSPMEVRSVQQVHPTHQLSPPSVLLAQDTVIPFIAGRGRHPLSTTSTLRRSVSTPNVRPQGTNDVELGPLSLPGEKKRNKLGYHRSSMACGRYSQGDIDSRRTDSKMDLFRELSEEKDSVSPG